jgi:hypothetical protein
MPKLSILVASITKRDDKLQRLLTSLHAQASALSNPEDVEILTSTPVSWTMTTGCSRTTLNRF